MEVVINDTNILIDLYQAGLLDYCGKLNIEFRTLDLIMAELVEEHQHQAVLRMVDEGKLHVCELTGLQMGRVANMINDYRGVCNLSVQDVSVLVYAMENNCRLLTGDRVLRSTAEKLDVRVSGILYLTDMMTDQGVIDNRDMAVALVRLLASNTRLPKRLIEERIAKLMPE